MESGEDNSAERYAMELQHFRKSMNEWVMFLNQQNKELRERIADLERRLARIEIEGQLRF